MTAKSTLRPLTRVFQWNGLEMPDPNPRLSAEEALKVLGTVHPELNNASLDGPSFQADRQVYTCSTRLGTKG